jgi:hypothetical protein
VELMELMIRALTFWCLTVWVAGPIRAQQSAPGGQVYGELLPFAGLGGVRVQVFGVGGAVYNIAGVNDASGASADPAKEMTGLSRTEQQQLYLAIRNDIVDGFRRTAVPLLERGDQSPDVTPRLEIDVAWHKTIADRIDIDVITRLMEAARLIKDPSKIVWSQSWGTRLAADPTSPELLAKDVQHLALSGVSQFLELYVRAHKD